MRRLSFSLAGLLAFTLVVAFWCAAFRYQTDLWASAAVSLSGLLLLLGTLAALLRPAGRPFWIGFALFGLAYFYVAAGGTEGVWPRLITSHLMRKFAANTGSQTQTASALAAFDGLVLFDSAGYAISAPYNTQVIGHSGLALLLALFGGIAGCLIRGRTAPTASPLIL